MINTSKYAVTAKLNNGKQVLLDTPQFDNNTLPYRYLTEQEIKSEQLDLKSNRIWLNAPIHRTVEDGVTIVFAVIEANPIVLHRM